MRTVLTTVFMAALSFTAFAQAPAGGADEAAIRKLAQQHDEARNKADWKGLSAMFTEDADQLTSAGEWRRGRAEIEKGVAQIMAGPYKGAKYVTTIDKVRMVAPTVAIADGTFEIQNIASGGNRRGRTTYTLVKSGGAWRIAASRTMVPTPVGATPPK